MRVRLQARNLADVCLMNIEAAIKKVKKVVNVGPYYIDILGDVYFCDFIAAKMTANLLNKKRKKNLWQVKSTDFDMYKFVVYL